MLGLIWFLFWQALGIFAALRLCPVGGRAVRIWLGSVFGSLLAIWTPVPFSFAFGFSYASHICAAALGLALLVLLLRLPRSGKPPASEPGELRALLRVLVPSVLVFSFLIISHTLTERNGSLYTGQCTYGDMPMHLCFVTSLARSQVFPPEYSILPGTRISYPFLCDSVSASLYLLGSPLRISFVLPALFAGAQVFAGFYFLARALCSRASSAALAFVFFFLNGGLGMIYFTGEYDLKTLFTAFYKTPTNLTEKGIRWVNVIVDMMAPQRATLFGWALLFAVLYLLFLAVFRGEHKLFLPAGIAAGLLPMIHTHSYLALGMIAAFWMLCSVEKLGGARKWFGCWLRFGLPAVLLALPQLFIWTFRSVGGNEQFLRLNLDWVNGGSEPWLWFWLKNVGPLFIFAPVAFALSDREKKLFSMPAFAIFAVCELVVFQPNVYDNNKLMYVSYALLCILCAEAAIALLSRIRRSGVRIAALALVVLVCANAAVFSLGRELLSGVPRFGYRLFGADDKAAAEYIDAQTPPDAVFLTASNHNNAVAVLGGRRIVCGSPSYLYYHGLDYSGRLALEELMLRDPEAFEAHRAELDVAYVYFGPAERALSPYGEAYFEENYPCVFSSAEVRIYEVVQRK